MSRKVLVVDDEKLIVKGIRFSLEQENMKYLKCLQKMIVDAFQLLNLFQLLWILLLIKTQN